MVATTPAMQATTRPAWHRWRKEASEGVVVAEGKNLDFFDPEDDMIGCDID